jgi:transglutaminase-like putative cysteine protease
VALSPALRRAWPADWRHLPRDCRDTLFQLAVIGWTLLPHLSHLPSWCIALTALMLLWRAQLALSNAPLPSRWAVAGVLLVAIVLTLWTEGTLLGKEAGVTMLVVLMALKTLELRARRDAMVVFFLGFFLVLTNFLYSQSLATAAAMLLSVWGLLAALVLAHMPVGKPTLHQAGAVAARTAALGAPLMVALFMLFPRIGPLWGMPQDAAGKTGLSGSMRMGAMAEIANDDTIAFRIRFDGRAPPPEAMYFRGPVLSRFDGREWTRQLGGATPAAASRVPVQLLGQPLHYQMTLEPSRLPLLPLLELTPDREGAAPQVEGFNAWQRSDLQWQTDRPVAERLRFEASAWLLHRHGPRQPTTALQEALALPAQYNPRALAWAAEQRARPELAQADARTLVAALLDHLRQGGFMYTLEPGAYTGANAVDEFWFERKLGFCEHFAASTVVMLRAMQVPARVVTGYMGADPAPVDGYHVVRQSNAHAWVEYWQAGEGWLRSDPTAAVSPDRIVRGTGPTPRPGLVANAIASVNPALLARLRTLLEAHQQPLEPVGDELLARAAVPAAGKPGRGQPELARPGLRADRAALRRQPGRRRLGVVGPPAPGSVAAAATTGAAATGATAGRGAAARAAAHPRAAGARAAWRARRAARAAARGAGPRPLRQRRAQPHRSRLVAPLCHGGGAGGTRIIRACVDLPAGCCWP